MSDKTINEVLEFYSNLEGVDRMITEPTPFNDVEDSFESVEQIGRIVFDSEEIDKRRRINIGDILTRAYQFFLPHKEKTVKASVDPDWMARFIDCAKDVSDNDMRLLWSKILSGELNKPNSISVMTLETLRNMSKCDAEIFHKLANYAVIYAENGETFIPNNGIYPGNKYRSDIDYGISYDELLWMEELRLINLNPGLQTTFTIDDNNKGLEISLSCGNLSIKISSKTKVVIPCYPYTRIGAQLRSLIEDITPNKAFFEDRIKDRLSSEKTKVEICNI